MELPTDEQLNQMKPEEVTKVVLEIVEEIGNYMNRMEQRVANLEEGFILLSLSFAKLLNRVNEVVTVNPNEVKH